MRTLFSKLALLAAFLLAITFTFSCSGDSGGGNGEQSNISSGTEASKETSSSSKGTSNSSSSSGTATGNSSSSSLGGSSSSKGSEVVGSVKKDKISGFSQKGPFTKGSSITLSELNDKLAQTGRSFEEIITDDKGSFEIKNIELVSPYVMLKVNGFYRNEVSGQISKAPINLYAIADIREKNNINVNILTHLEYYRVQKLVDGGKSLKDAKKQAQKEILAIFNISGDFKDSEDMSIFGTSDGDAALLAISVLLQGNLTEGQFTERLADFSTGFRETGTWDNNKEKKAIADWATIEAGGGYCLYPPNMEYPDDSNCWPMPTQDNCKVGTLVNSCSNPTNVLTPAKVRSNISAWNLSSSVPDFEKYVNSYWISYYDFGACDTKKAGEIKDGPNGKKYICKDNAWVIATEKDVACGNKSKSCFTDARDKQQYYYVKIGEQTWMAQNLNYEAKDSKCYGENGKVTLSNAEIQANCDKYGRLYLWATAMACVNSSCVSQISAKHRGVCPAGWHIPSKAEWQELVDLAGGDKVAGKKLKATIGWSYPRDGGTDDYGFSALPGGRGYNKSYTNGNVTTGNYEFWQGAGAGRQDSDEKGFWWSSSEFDRSDDEGGYNFAYHLNIEFNAYVTEESKWTMYSVRCLQD